MFNANKKIKIFLVIVIAFMCVAFFNNIEAATYTRNSGAQIGYVDGALSDKPTKKEISATTFAVVYYDARIDGDKAYCLDMIRAVPSSGTSVTQQGQLTELATGVMVEGRTSDPLATQLALWKIYSGSYTPKWYGSNYLKSGMSGVNQGQFTSAMSKAQDLINAAQAGVRSGKYSGTSSSSSNVDASISFDKSKRTTTIQNGYVYRGPYVLTTNSGSPITFSHGSTGAVAIVKSIGGSSVSSFSSGEAIYIKAPVGFSYGGSSGKVVDYPITFYTKKTVNSGKTYKGYVYSAGSNYQRFAVLKEESTPQTFEGKLSVKFGWEVAGSIEIVKSSDKGGPIAGVQFGLYDGSKNQIKVATTDSNGRVVFDNLQFGMYYIKEISAPKGYKILNSGYESVYISSADTVKKNFTNHYIAGRVKVAKYVQYGMLSGKQSVGSGDATFGIYTTSGAKVATMTTDGSGMATSQDLPMGDYYVKEESVNTSYMKLNPLEKRSFSITEANDNQTITLDSFTNEGLTGSFEIYKYAIENGTQTPISGAKFQLNCPNGETKELVTNGAGKVSVNELIDGNYTYCETYVPRGYVLDSSTKSFTISKTNKSVKVQVKNEVQYGKLYINKTREGAGTPIAGVKFNVYASNKQTIVATLVTDANGRASITDLKYGTYYIKEVEAPDNVIMNTKEEKVIIDEVENGGQLEYTLNLTNEVIVDCAIRIYKIDSSNKAPIKGVRFALYSDAEGNNKIAETDTDVNGLALFKNLKEGTYYYKEISTPEGYITNAPQICEVSIITDYTNKDGEERKEKCELSMSQPIVLKEGNQIYNTTIENTPIVGKVKIHKKDEDGRPLAGAEFDIKDLNNTVVGHLVTDANGEAISGDLRKGNYKLVETKAPKGYVVITEAKEFDITSHNQIKDLGIIVNEYQKGQLKIKKVDSDTKEFINGAIFEIYKINDDGTEVKVDTISNYDENGVGKSGELKNGKYYFVETKAPYGAIIDTNKYEFVINDDVKLVEKTVENRVMKGQIALIKTGEPDENGEIPFIEGAKFDLLNADKNAVLETLVTDANGAATSKKYKIGTYYIRETYAPETWVPLTSDIKVEITEDGQVITLKDEIVNKKIRGGIRITKKDDAGNLIAGVEYTIYKEGSTMPIEKIVTDENGIAMTTDLKVGKYYFVETRVPDNLYINSESVDFEIVTVGQLLDREVVNNRVTGKLVITKLNDENGTGIEGVVFEVYDSNEKVLGKITTNVDGIATTADLKNAEGKPIVLYTGTYYFKEVSAPDRFYFDDSLKNFEIKKGAENVEMTVYNTPFKIPQTGAAISTDAWIVIIVSIVSITGYVIGNILINRKRFA